MEQTIEKSDDWVKRMPYFARPKKYRNGIKIHNNVMKFISRRISWVIESIASFGVFLFDIILG